MGLEKADGKARGALNEQSLVLENTVSLQIYLATHSGPSLAKNMAYAAKAKGVDRPASLERAAGASEPVARVDLLQKASLRDDSVVNRTSDGA